MISEVIAFCLLGAKYVMGQYCLSYILRYNKLRFMLGEEKYWKWFPTRIRVAIGFSFLTHSKDEGELEFLVFNMNEDVLDALIPFLSCISNACFSIQLMQVLSQVARGTHDTWSIVTIQDNLPN